MAWVDTEQADYSVYWGEWDSSCTTQAVCCLCCLEVLQQAALIHHVWPATHDQLTTTSCTHILTHSYSPTHSVLNHVTSTAIPLLISPNVLPTTMMQFDDIQLISSPPHKISHKTECHLNCAPIPISVVLTLNHWWMVMKCPDKRYYLISYAVPLNRHESDQREC